MDRYLPVKNEIYRPSQNVAQQWGIPDWRDKTAYPDFWLPVLPKAIAKQYAADANFNPGQVLLSQSAEENLWRWQFLRRYPAYREAWLKQKDKPKSGQEFGLLGLYLDPRETAPFLKFHDIRRNNDSPTLSWTFPLLGNMEDEIETLKEFWQMSIKHHKAGIEAAGGKFTRPRQRGLNRREWPKLLRLVDAIETYDIGVFEAGREVFKKEVGDKEKKASLYYRTHYPELQKEMCPQYSNTYFEKILQS